MHIGTGAAVKEINILVDVQHAFRNSPIVREHLSFSYFDHQQWLPLLFSHLSHCLDLSHRCYLTFYHAARFFTFSRQDHCS